MVMSKRYIVKKDVYLLLALLLFSLVITLLSFEYGIATLIATITTVGYYLAFEKSVNNLFNNENSKLSVISIYIIGLLRYVCIGGGTILIFFLFSSFSVRLYTIIIIVIAWFLCIGLRNRR